MVIPLEISSVASLWPSSSLAAQPETAVMPSGPEYTPLTIALLIIVTLAFLRQIVYAVTGSALILFTPGTHSDRSEGVSFNKAADITAIFCIPIVSICLTLTGISRLSGIGTFAVTASYVLLQIIFFRIARFFSEGYAKEGALIRARSVLILFSILCVPAAMLAVLSPTAGKSISYIYLLVIASLSAAYYAVSSCITIIRFRFSYFFTFLYLCGVQLLPLAATVKLLL